MIYGAQPEKIVEQRTGKNGDREFLIKWKGYQSFDNSWTRENQLPSGFLKKYQITSNGSIKTAVNLIPTIGAIGYINNRRSSSTSDEQSYQNSNDDATSDDPNASFGDALAVGAMAAAGLIL